jgi:monovalent cation/proton antiporter MnhG/PhaG subunit
MIKGILEYIILIFTVLSNFFMFSAIVGFVRYKDFYIKLHAVSMFNVYGINFILFSIGINSYDPIIFFEILLVILINTLINLAVIHVLMRNAILGDIKYDAKTRDQKLKEKTEKMKEKELKNKIQKEKEEEERKLSEAKKEKDKKEENKNKIKKMKEEIKEIEKEPNKTGKTEEVAVAESEADEKIRKENEELKEKIKEQKKILKKKIETARKNAFITRKPEEIEKTEKMIKDILIKYHLTEEMLNEED